nr:hypothetical protein [uncultured Desulfobulbus sp.]
MNPKLRAFLLANGLRADATEDEAWKYYKDMQGRGVTFDGPERAGGDGQRSEPSAPAAPPAAQGGTPVPQPATPQAAPPQAPGSTRSDDGFARALEIMELCNRHGIEGEQRQALLKPEVSIDQVRSVVLETLAQRSSAHHPGFAPSGVVVQVDERDKFRAAACTGMFLRCGLPLDGKRGLAIALESCGWKVDRAHDIGRDFVGYSLREIARDCLRKAGLSESGDPMEMIGRAMTASDLPVLMSNVANKALFEGYASAEETWEIWADGTGSVPDFKQNTLAMVSEFDDLEPIVNDTGYKYGDRTDAKEVYQIGTYGKMAAITRTTVINDDLMGMADMYMSMGEAASRKIGDCAYGVLTANAAMRDGVALFHANHKNLGTPGALGEATIAEAIKLARMQKGLKEKQKLNIPLMYFIGPASIEGSAEIFFASNQFSADDKGSTRTNIYGGTRFQRAYDARLDDVSPTAYYFAGPKRKTVRLFFLNGNRIPWLEAKTGWTTDGVEYKVRIDVCGKAVDWKALVKNAGE